MLNVNIVEQRNPLAVASGDFMLDVALGNVPGVSSVNKFGRSTNVDNGIDTDIWDRANATNDQDIWIAPTAARIHQITSVSVNDDEGNTGARELRVFGLQTWDSKEVSEDIIMNGVANVATVNAYVIIHRMEVIRSGGTNISTGLITATADTDGTVTAQINADEGQTQMAIYGLPSTQCMLVTSYYASMNKATPVSIQVGITLLLNPEPNRQLTEFLVKSTNALISGGSSHIQHIFRPYVRYDGPGILKMQGNSTTNDADISAGFDLFLVDI